MLPIPIFSLMCNYGRTLNLALILSICQYLQRYQVVIPSTLSPYVEVKKFLSSLTRETKEYSCNTMGDVSILVSLQLISTEFASGGSTRKSSRKTFKLSTDERGGDMYHIQEIILRRRSPWM